MGMIRDLIIRWLARRYAPAEFAFPHVLRNARRVMVLMPLSLEAFRLSEYFLSRLPQAFPDAKITLLYPPKSLAPRFYNPHGYRVVVPEPRQVWWFSLPRRAFLEKLFESKFDVIIILNKEPSVFYSAAVMASGTAVRIGLPGGMGAPFVTVELRHGRDDADVKTEFILFVEMLRKMSRVVPPPDESSGAGLEPTSPLIGPQLAML